MVAINLFMSRVTHGADYRREFVINKLTMYFIEALSHFIQDGLRQSKSNNNSKKRMTGPKNTP